MNFRNILEIAERYRAALLRLALFAIISSASALTLPWFAGELFGTVIDRDASTSVARPIGLLVAALLVTSMFSVIAGIQTAVLEIRVLTDLRQRIFEHVQRLPIGFHENRGKGDTLALMTYEVGHLSHYLTGTMALIPARLLTAIGAIAAMFWINARTALIVPFLIPAIYLFLKILGRSLRGVAAAIQHAEAEVVEVAEQSLDILPATKAFTREVMAAANYRVVTEEAARLSVNRRRIEAMIDPMLGLIAAVASILVLLTVGQGLRAGNLNVAELFSFLFYAMLLTRPASALSHIYGETQNALGTSARMQSVLEQSVEQMRTTKNSRRAQGKIVFENISFAYPGRDSLLRNLDLEISPGEKIAIVGPNGSGKTALVNLLLRYYEPDGGRILLDDTDIRDYGFADLRQQIGLVPQTPLLFNSTIRDNVCFGSPDASPVDLNRVLQLAQAKKFIDDLPKGLETTIGDRGVRLSGGQKQRLALARALIKDPPILILDEATSMFDLGGEVALVAGIEKAIKGRTVIFITHRLMLLDLADRIFEINDGKLVDIGKQRTRS